MIEHRTFFIFEIDTEIGTLDVPMLIGTSSFPISVSIDADQRLRHGYP